MGGCASRPKESDMNNEESSVPNKPVSETVVQENNTEESSEKQNQTETETTSVEPKEASEVEPTKETSPAAEPEVAAAVEESSSAGKAAAPENVAATENAEAAVEAVVVATPEKVEFDVETTKTAEAEPVKEEKEAVVAV
ncbi:PREDICTED: neurofilament heavy polypeptide-like [Brassica oleracea var. oleracea]|uniref:Uncharacterized protein n=1 Tax=Brassica oleracea var. oleracea TaxID=109376 RepID=A0A0D3BG18_BRAOL|nr:PREDICTED: neurofilament heavy polypeptide-like [Brassica oleracea var. oleracea]